MRGKVAVIGAGQGGITFSLLWILNKVVPAKNLTLFESPAGGLKKRLDVLQQAESWTFKIANPKDAAKIKSTHEITTLPKVTNDIATAVTGADYIHILTPAHHHRGLVSSLASHIDREGAYLIIHSDGVGGTLCARKILHEDTGSKRQQKVRRSVQILGTETLGITCKAFVNIEEGTVTSLLKRQKNNLLATGVPIRPMEKNMAKVQPFFLPTKLQPCNDPLEEGVHDSPAFHALGMLGNVSKIMAVARGDRDPFNFYLSFTKKMTERMERFDKERARISVNLGMEPAKSCRTFLNGAYDIALTDKKGRRRSLHEMLNDRKTPYYGGPEVSPAPSILTHRYLTEELPTRVVPMWSLGKALDMDVPVHQSVIDEVIALGMERIVKEGRTLAAMGISRPGVRKWKETVKQFY